MGRAAALGDDGGAVAIDVKRHDRVREAAPVVIEIEDRVDESVRQAEIMPHGIGVADVEIGLDQLRCEIAAGGTVPVSADDLIRALAPDIAVVGAPRAAKWARIDCIESKDAE